MRTHSACQRLALHARATARHAWCQPGGGWHPAAGATNDWASRRHPGGRLAVRSRFLSTLAEIAEAPTLSAAVRGESDALPSSHYASLVADGLIEPSSHQEFVLDQLDSLAGQLGRHQRAMGDYVQQFEDWQPLRDEAERAEVERRRVGSSTRLGRLRDRMSRARGLAPPPLVEQMSDEALGVPLPPRVPRVPRGIYLHGSVGTGKSLLMDMLFAATGSTVKHRRRVHYAAFMLEIHRRIHEHRIAPNRPGVEVHPLAAVAVELITGAPFGIERAEKFTPRDDNALLLCFDEFQVTEVGDAVLVRGVLDHLFSMGVCVVTTSNRAPHELDRNRLQEGDFQAFLKTLRSACTLIPIGGQVDYRAYHATNDPDPQKRLHWPLGPDAATWLDETFEELARREPAAAAASGSAPRSDRGAAVPVMFGRELLVSRAAGGVACFTFDELCNRPLGAPDYMALATQFHTVCLSEVPQLSIGQRDQARRFIVLVDELYNRGCKLFMTTEVELQLLFAGEDTHSFRRQDEMLALAETMQFEAEAIDGSKKPMADLEAAGLAIASENRAFEAASESSLFTGEDEEFAFKRAVSRLAEMQSARYAVTAALRDGTEERHGDATGSTLREAISAAAAAAAAGKDSEPERPARHEGDRSWYASTA